jgi:hypothetical protein
MRETKNELHINRWCQWLRRWRICSRSSTFCSFAEGSGKHAMQSIWVHFSIISIHLQMLFFRSICFQFRNISSSLNACLSWAGCSNVSHWNCSSKGIWQIYGWKLILCLAFQSAKVVPSSLKNRWGDCLSIISKMDFFVTHI